MKVTWKFSYKNLHNINARYSNYYSCTVTKRIVMAKVKSEKYIKQLIPSSRGEQHSNWRRVQTVLPHTFYFQSAIIYIYSAYFPQINLTNSPLYLFSCTQQLSPDLLSSISNFPDLPLRVPHLHFKLTNLQTSFLGDTVAGWRSD